MKLHYSQTLAVEKPRLLLVSVPYEITLLSNSTSVECLKVIVSVPYEITLLSNSNNWTSITAVVSVPYEITLLSNPSAN